MAWGIINRIRFYRRHQHPRNSQVKMYKWKQRSVKIEARNRVFCAFVMVDYSYFCSNTRARLNRGKTVRVWDSWTLVYLRRFSATMKYDTDTIIRIFEKDNPVPYNNLKSICPSASWWTALAGERTKGRSAARMLIRILIQRKRKRNQETTAHLLLTLIGSFHPYARSRTRVFTSLKVRR